MTDDCKYERIIGQIEQHSKATDANIAEIKSDIKDLLAELNGDSGLISKVKSHATQLLFLKWIVGIILVAIVGGKLI